MKLSSINIHQNYGHEKGYTGNIVFKGQHGEVSLNLDEELSKKVVAVCAEAIVEASKEVAENMTLSFQEELQTPAIEHKEPS